jgi:uncharacterized repeat protein (TIGR03987 family)
MLLIKADVKFRQNSDIGKLRFVFTFTVKLEKLILSTTLITLALVFYSLGVWTEKIARYLKPWHVAAFWTGFIFDVSGTLAMHKLANGTFNLAEPHTLTGQIAIILMLAHAIWATNVVKKGSVSARSRFHSYSLIVWVIWLVPYFGGMFMGMTR